MEKPYVPFYKPYGMSDEEYQYEVELAQEKLAEWEQEQNESIPLELPVMLPPNTFLNADCMDYLPKCPAGYFDLAIIDPQYGINYSNVKHPDRPTEKWKNPNSIVYEDYDDSKPPSEEYFRELFRVSKNQIIWGANNFEGLPSSGGWVVWDKKVDPKERLSMAELAWTSFNKKVMIFRYLWAGFKKAEQIKRIHPNEKPVALYKWLLRNYAKQGDLILDTHAGSASSLVACVELGFDYVGFEIKESYYKKASERVRRAFRKYELNFEQNEAAT